MVADAQVTLELPDLAAMHSAAQRLADLLDVPMTIALSGTLGAGKTQFVRFLAAALSVPSEEVTSPTYVLVQRYRGRFTIYHLDWYRLNSPDEVWNLGVDEWFESPVLTIVEWSEKFPQCLPDQRIEIHIEQLSGGTSRRMTVRGPGWVKRLSEA